MITFFNLSGEKSNGSNKIVKISMFGERILYANPE